MDTKKTVTLGLLTGLALILFTVEMQIPNPLPIPGVKLGLSNIITVYCVFRFTPAETALVVSARLLLGAMFSGNFSALIYSACGAFCCLLGMLALRKLLPAKQIWICSVIGAMFHNLGQIIAAIAVMRSPAVLSYLPVLLVLGSLAGLFTGLTAQLVIGRFPPAKKE